MTNLPASSGRVFPSKKAWQLIAQKSDAWHNSGLFFIATMVSTVTTGPLYPAALRQERAVPIAEVTWPTEALPWLTSSLPTLTVLMRFQL